MSKRKNIDDLDVNDLLQELETAEDIKGSPSLINLKFTSSDPVLDFIEYFDIKAGNVRVRPSLLYKLFYNYSNLPIKRQAFLTSFGLYFTPLHNVYMLDIDTVKLGKLIVQLEKQRVLNNHKMMVPSFESFLEKSKIKPGLMPVKVTNLFYVYKKFNTNIGARLNIKIFSALCKITFPYYVGDRWQRKSNMMTTLYICVDKQSILKYIPREELHRERAQAREFWGSIDEREKKRRSKEKSKRKKAYYPKVQKRIQGIRAESKPEDTKE